MADTQYSPHYVAELLQEAHHQLKLLASQQSTNAFVCDKETKDVIRRLLALVAADEHATMAARLGDSAPHAPSDVAIVPSQQHDGFHPTSVALRGIDDATAETGLCCVCGMDGVKGSFFKRGFKCSRCIGTPLASHELAHASCGDHPYAAKGRVPLKASLDAPSSSYCTATFVPFDDAPDGAMGPKETHASRHDLLMQLRLLAHPSLLQLYACGEDTKRRRVFFVHEEATEILRCAQLVASQESDSVFPPSRGSAPPPAAQFVDLVANQLVSVDEDTLLEDASSPRSVLLFQQGGEQSFEPSTDLQPVHTVSLVGFVGGDSGGVESRNADEGEPPSRGASVFPQSSPSTPSSATQPGLEGDQSANNNSGPLSAAPLMQRCGSSREQRDAILRSTVHLEWVRKAFFSVLQALDALHAQRICHGSCGLSNMFVDDRGNVRLRCSLTPSRAWRWYLPEDPIIKRLLPPEASSSDPSSASPPPLSVASDIFMLGASIVTLLLDPHGRAPPQLSPRSLLLLALEQSSDDHPQKSDSSSSHAHRSRSGTVAGTSSRHVHQVLPFLRLLEQLTSDDPHSRGSAAKALKHEIFALIRVANGVPAENMFVSIACVPVTAVLDFGPHTPAPSTNLEDTAHKARGAERSEDDHDGTTTAFVRRSVSWSVKDFHTHHGPGVSSHGRVAEGAADSPLVSSHHNEGATSPDESFTPPKGVSEAPSSESSPSCSVGSHSSLSQLRSTFPHPDRATTNLFISDLGGVDKGTSQGASALGAFLKEHGPRFQVVRSGPSSLTLYSVRSDPRRRRYSDASSTQRVNSGLSNNSSTTGIW